MAWTEKLPSGRYRGLYRDAAGGKQRVEGTFPHKAAAREAADDAERAVRRGGNAPSRHRPTLGELADMRLLLRPEGIVAATTAERDQDLTYAVLARFGERTLAEAITLPQVQLWVAEMLTEKPRPKGASTIRKRVYALAGMLDLAVQSGHLDVNQARKVKLPDPPPSRSRTVEKDDALRLVEQMPAVWGLATWLLASAGMRWGELAGAHVDQFDELHRTFTVSRTQLQLKGGVRRIKEYPKNPKSSRPVPLPKVVAEGLAAHLKEHPPVPCGLPHDDGQSCPGLLLYGRGRRPLSRHHYPRTLRSAAEQVGLPAGLRPHDLRHAAATMWAEDGVPLAEIARQLGQSQLSVTNRYIHLTPGASEKVRESMDRLWGAGS